jgi:alkanesulfonate monooxygenase SsuD/methylene tetrahydromethanopterin reductase-like flavin-dependent oxidoreductase (luciferase family)
MFMNVLEPVTLLTALAGATTRIGLGGTVSTSFSEPYNVARQFASLDHISAGRAAWNVVTSANDYAARNFGHATLPPHALRYEKAGEFVDVVNALWNTWDDDAFILDRASGLFFEPAGLHAVHHEGKFFKVDGALNIARSPPKGIRSSRPGRPTPGGTGAGRRKCVRQRLNPGARLAT